MTSSDGDTDPVPTTPETAASLSAEPPRRDTSPIIAGYTEGELLGRGGMGEVVLAHDQHIGRYVAIKRMRGESPSEQASVRFLREARVQARLEHPAIVPVYQLGTASDGTPFFTMKRLTGVTLQKLIQGEVTAVRMTAPDEFGNRLPGPFPPIATGDKKLDGLLSDFLAIKYGDRTDTTRYALAKTIARRLETNRRPADAGWLLALLSDEAFDVGKCSPTDEGRGTPAVKRARKQAWNAAFGAWMIRTELMRLVVRGALLHRACDARLAELAGKGSVDKGDILGDAIEASEARTLDLGPKLVAALGARAARCKERGSSDSTVKALLRVPVEKAFDALAPLVRAWGAPGRDIMEVLAQDIDEMQDISLDPRWRPILHKLIAKKSHDAFDVLAKMPRHPSDVPTLLAAIASGLEKVKPGCDMEFLVDERALVMLCESGDKRALPALLAITQCDDFGYRISETLFPAIASLADASAVKPLEAFIARHDPDDTDDMVVAARRILKKLGAKAKPAAPKAAAPAKPEKPRPYGGAGKTKIAPKTTAAEERAKMLARFTKAKLSAEVAGKLKHALRGAIRVYTKRVADGSLPLGTSRLGGLPDLAPGASWPRLQKVPMLFVAQLRLEELAPFDVDRLLPKRGLLAFFLDEAMYAGGKVLYFADTKGLVRTPAPEGLVDRPSATAAVRFHTAYELPTGGTREARALGKEAEELELPESLEIPRPATLNQVLGYDDYRGYDAEPPKGTRPLFRCESDGQADLNFGDSQDIAFRIADADLAAVRFDRVRLWFQTG